MLAAAAGISSNSRNRARQPRPNCSASIQCTSADGHRRRGGLQLDQRLAERRGVLVRDGRLEHAQRLAELHRPALELAEHGEQLLRALGHAAARRSRRRCRRPAGVPSPAAARPATPSGRLASLAVRAAVRRGMSVTPRPHPVPSSRTGVPRSPGGPARRVHTMIVSPSRVSALVARSWRIPPVRGRAAPSRRRTRSPGAGLQDRRATVPAVASSSSVASQVGGRAPPLTVESRAASACATPSAAVAAVAAGSARPGGRSAGPRRSASRGAGAARAARGSPGRPSARAAPAGRPRRCRRASGPAGARRRGRAAGPAGPARGPARRPAPPDRAPAEPAPVGRRHRAGPGAPRPGSPPRAGRPRSASTCPVPRSAGQHRSRRLGVHRAHPGLDQPEDHPDGQRPVPADHDRALGPVPARAGRPAPASTTAPASTSSRSSCSATSSARAPLHRPLQQRRPPGPARPARPASRPAPGCQLVHGQRARRIEPEQPAVGARAGAPTGAAAAGALAGRAGSGGDRWLGRHGSMVAGAAPDVVANHPQAARPVDNRGERAPLASAGGA